MFTLQTPPPASPKLYTKFTSTTTIARSIHILLPITHPAPRSEHTTIIAFLQKYRAQVRMRPNPQRRLNARPTASAVLALF